MDLRTDFIAGCQGIGGSVNDHGTMISCSLPGKAIELDLSIQSAHCTLKVGSSDIIAQGKIRDVERVQVKGTVLKIEDAKGDMFAITGQKPLTEKELIIRTSVAGFPAYPFIRT